MNQTLEPMQGRAELPPLIAREALFGNPEREAARVSPDGAKLAYLAPHEGKLGVWVRTLGADDGRLIAHDPQRPIKWIAWRGDSRQVLFLQDRAGDENYHLYAADLQGAKPRELTPGENLRCLPVAIDDRFPDECLVALNARNAGLFDVYRIDLRGGEPVLDTENPGDVLGWFADNALTVRAAVAQLRSGDACIRVRDDARSPWRVLDEYAFADGVPAPVAFSPDGCALYVKTAKGANASRLVRYDLQTGDSRPVFECERYDVDACYVDPGTREIVAVAVLEERLQWYAIDPSFREVLDALRRAADGDFTIESASADGTMLGLRYRFDTAPDRYFAYDRRSGRATHLFCDRPALLDAVLAAMQPISFPARDGLEIHGYLTLPAGVEPRNLPTVLYVHGGPWYRDRWGYEPTVQWLANRGYAVLQVNFRGSTGYGKDFVNAGNRQWAGAMRTDLLDARDWAIAQGFADPQRFAVFGGSYGGYAVLAALTFTPTAFTCGVDICGPSNLNTFMESIPAYWAPMRKLLTERVGEDPAFLDAQSPLARAGEICVPLLIGQGANDPRVKQHESDQIVAAMRANGVPVAYAVFEDEGHGFMDPENAKRFTALAESFLAAALGGRLEPASAAEEIAPFLR